MSETTKCPRCGVQLLDDAPAGLCPKCLVAAGFESNAPYEPTIPAQADSGFEPPPAEQLGPLFPQLEILELLGRGGMGAVYKARQKELDRLVAVKILPPEVGQNPAFAERFTREARAMAKLSHPNIVMIHDFGQAEGLFYFVMEYIDGANLREAMQAGLLKPELALEIVPQVCDALQYAHDEGIVHRDIKPENVLVNSKGAVKIADFGLSKLLGLEETDFTLTGTRQVMGTPRYMAPEQMQETKSVDHRADIYSLGVVFYELLTGELPMGRFDPPSKKVQIDVRLDEVVLKTLESQPEQRYQHASDIKSDVEMISNSHVALPPNAVPVEKASDAVYSRRMAWITIGAWFIWSALVTVGLVAYVQGAEWYFDKDDLFRKYLDVGFFSSSIPLGMFLVLFWYTLAKSPDAPRSFHDFWTTAQMPDRRMRRIWLPVGVYLAAYGIATAVTMTTAGDDVQAITMHLFLIAAPLVFMATCVRAYGLPALPAGDVSHRRQTRVS